MMALYKMLIEKDITMLEINPMVETADGRGKLLIIRLSYCS